MAAIGEQFQSADWKNEKHVPVIECPENVKPDELFDVTVSIGKEIAHPNTAAHHIRWIELFFKPDNDKFTYQVGSYTFGAHGESAEGADKGSVHAHHSVTARMKVTESGTLMAASLCNIHGLWRSEKTVKTG